MWLCNHVSMPPYEYAIISNYHTRVQLENFSNLASWTTKWNDYVPRYDKPLLLWPDGLLKFCRQQPFGVWKLSVSGAVGRMTARGLKCVWKIFWRCLEYIWKVSLISCFKVSGKLLKMTRIQVRLGILGARKLDRGLCLSRIKNCADYDSRGFEPATPVATHYT